MSRQKKPRSDKSRMTVVLAVVTAIGAVLGVGLNAQKIVDLVSGARARSREVGAHVQLADTQLAAADYGGAWRSLEQAAAIAPEDARVRTAQEDTAMAWLRDVRLGAGGPETFSAAVAPLVPVLDRGAATAADSRRADLLAHRGWAEFLRERDEPEHHDPRPFYTQALAVDPANPYANAMLGHWMLWEHEDRAAATQRFEAAASSGRARAYVRRLELSALKNASRTENASEIVRVANAIRREGGSVDPRTRRDIHSLYYDVAAGREDAILDALPPEEHVACYRWLFAAELDDAGTEASYVFTLARLEAHAGHVDAARAELTKLRSRAEDPALVRQVDGELARLGR